MWLSSSASQIDVPAGAFSSAPSGQYSGWGRILMIGMTGASNLFDGAARQGLPDAAIHSLGGEGFGALRERLDGCVDRMVVVVLAGGLHLRKQRFNASQLVRTQQIAIGG